MWDKNGNAALRNARIYLDICLNFKLASCREVIEIFYLYACYVWNLFNLSTSIKFYTNKPLTDWNQYTQAVNDFKMWILSLLTSVFIIRLLFKKYFEKIC